MFRKKKGTKEKLKSMPPIPNNQSLLLSKIKIVPDRVNLMLNNMSMTRFRYCFLLNIFLSYLLQTSEV